tara:strand:+ start:1395 stop:1928 length:534 start_codon:yes stop_codon:yes gene_type:complete
VSTNEENTSGIKTPKQLIIVILLAFIVPVTVFVLLAQYSSGGLSKNNRSGISSEESLAQRIKPIGSLILGDASQLAKNVQKKDADLAISTMPKADAGPASIEDIYSSSCSACHASGAAGAPKLGDKEAWAPRVEDGIEILYSSAIKGKNAMPPKGGNTSLSNEDVKAVVDYMVSKIK